MQKLTIFCLFILFGIGLFFSCEREYNNPYDRDCPPEMWTPENLVADTTENSVLLTWEQTVKHFDGFLIDRSADSSNWKKISTKTIDKETREFTDTTVSAGDTLFYRISAMADKNVSNYCYSNRVVIPISLSTVNTNDVTNITSTTATFNGEVTSSGGATVSERGFCYATTQMPDITKIKVTSSSGIGTFIKIITGLMAETKYYVRAYAINSAGTAYGEQKTFTTTAKSLCDESTYDVITDSRDGHEYKTMVIGTQTWMAENLAYLPKVNDVSQSSATVAYYYVYDYNGTSVDDAKKSSYYSTCGALYNTTAARNSCPAGWHLPFDNEWVELIDYLVDNGYGYNGGSDIAKALASGNGWDYNSYLGTVGNHQEENNLSCFTGLPAGVANGSFYDIGGAAHWSSYNSGAFHIFSSSTTLSPCGYGSTVGLPVRCIKGEITAYPPNVVTNNVTNIGSSGATFNGSVTDAGTLSVTKRGFCYGLDEAPDINGNKVTSGSGTGGFVSSVTGLLADTLYNVRAYAISDIGISYGEQVEFRTAKDVTVTDIDGNIYHTVKIGTQTWMVENLKTSRYRDGTAIPNVTNNESWAALTTGAYCDYDNTPSNSTTYGKLYNWYAINANRNIAPTGWHVPSDAEWTILINYLGGENIAGDKLKEAGTTHWEIPNAGATNETGFSALPGGFRSLDINDGRFFNVGYNVDFWSSPELNTSVAWSRGMLYNESNVSRRNNYKHYGLSVRCIKD